jgi:molybdopterin adenylyltransferase
MKCRIWRVDAAIITVSDSCYAGSRKDTSGPLAARALEEAGFAVRISVTVPDDVPAIAAAIRDAAAAVRLVVTTGGTGIAARDVTPEATGMVCERILAGFGELMRAEGRKSTEFAALSRAGAGTLGTALVVNVPGSPKGAVESLRVVLPLVPHALALLAGDTAHGDSSPEMSV